MRITKFIIKKNKIKIQHSHRKWIPIKAYFNRWYARTTKKSQHSNIHNLFLFLSLLIKSMIKWMVKYISWVWLWANQFHSHSHKLCTIIRYICVWCVSQTNFSCVGFLLKCELFFRIQFCFYLLLRKNWHRFIYSNLFEWIIIDTIAQYI